MRIRSTGITHSHTRRPRRTRCAEDPEVASASAGGGGFAGEIGNVGYTRAMLQAVLTL
jgi:hypothetical protein